MARQSITLAKQNDEWLKKQIVAEEFNSKSEAVNYLIKKEREREAYDAYVSMKLDRGEKSGISKKQSREEILAEFKNRLSNV
ncbi:ribbon-helix-helix domain-containing protein [Chryseobacterium sp. MP_3.2]|uniref:ribbon-helix-helix domain-containing protein n=1 Tax=Chryseobacterium sp. MP_3.2 TaxID=3071712 RepID=UPI002DFF8F3F|nr:antitoxin ParD1/3/4 [Chryseobacterium sp. MP_3.2]